MKDVTIIGNGIIGLCSAYFLNKKGVQVTVIDKASESHKNCSFGNAGMLVPSHFEPLAAPGIISKGLRWMLNSSSPFYIKPRLNRDLFNWLWQFYRHANNSHVLEHSGLLHELNKVSNELYKEIAANEGLNFDYRENGLMLLYKTTKAANAELELGEKAKGLGIDARILDKKEVIRMQGVELDIQGGLLFAGDAQLNPHDFMEKMRALLRLRGVKFIYDTEVSDFLIERDKVVGVRTNQGDLKVNQLVFAMGAWSGVLAKKLRLKIPIQGGKGYSFTVDDPNQSLAIPSIFSEAKLAVTPFRNKMRFAGTMEIAGLTSMKNEKRIQAIKNAIPTYWPAFQLPDVPTQSVWTGLRPCSPDGIPYIGKGHYQNLFIATGHAMMGMSMGPVTGMLLSQLMFEEKVDFDMEKLSPLRYS